MSTETLYGVDRFLDKYLPTVSNHSADIKRKLVICNNSPEILDTILILGPTGSGKSRLARIITAHRCWVQFQLKHRLKGEFIKAEHWGDLEAKWLNGGVKCILDAFDDPFVSVHVSNIQGDIFESELFGHVAGAFTDAKKDKQGLLEKKPLFDALIDEIGYADIPSQRKLLQLLQEKTYRRKGGTATLHCDARLIFATNTKLTDLLSSGRLQEDFYYRLCNGMVLEIQALSDRREEIKDIAEDILGTLKAKLSEVDPLRVAVLSHKDLEFAHGYSWPGNIRQLEAALRNWLATKKWEPGVTLEKMVLSSAHKYAVSLDISKNLESDLRDHFVRRLERAVRGERMVSPAHEIAEVKAAAEEVFAACISTSSFTKTLESLGEILENPTKDTLQRVREWVSRRKR